MTIGQRCQLFLVVKPMVDGQFQGLISVQEATAGLKKPDSV